MRIVRLVGVGVVVPWLACAALVPACGGKVAGGGAPGPGSGNASGSGTPGSGTSSGAPGSGSGVGPGGSGGVGGSSGSSGSPNPGGPSDGCQPDTNVTGCTYPTFGFACYVGQSPDEADSSLVCSTPTPDPVTGLDLYCCEDTSSGGGSSGSSSGGPDGCATDSTLACDAGTIGMDCTGNTNPEAVIPGYVCSPPVTQSDGTLGYCCAGGFAGSTCAGDVSVAGCVYPSVGFSCTGSDTPDQADAALNCSAGVVDPQTGDTLYCCQ